MNDNYLNKFYIKGRKPEICQKYLFGIIHLLIQLEVWCANRPNIY